MSTFLHESNTASGDRSCGQKCGGVIFHVTMTSSQDKKHISFNKLIPYNKSILNGTQINALYPLISSTSNKTLKLWRTNILIPIIFNIICQLNYVTQIWFIFEGDSPYKWIIFGFFCFVQIFILLGIAAVALTLFENKRGYQLLVCCGGILLARSSIIGWIRMDMAYL